MRTLSVEARAAIAVAAWLFAAQAAPAFACGYCVEDKIAATYDHAVLSRAIVRRHEVAFFSLEGPAAASAQLQRELVQALESTRGVDSGTARVALESASLSFAYDPARHTLGSIMSSLNGKLAAKGLSVALLKTLK